MDYWLYMVKKPQDKPVGYWGFNIQESIAPTMNKTKKQDRLAGYWEFAIPIILLGIFIEIKDLENLYQPFWYRITIAIIASMILAAGLWSVYRYYKRWKTKKSN